MRPHRWGAVLVGLGLLAGCSTTVPGTATPAVTEPAVAVPEDVDALGDLVVTEVPSGLPRLPDDELDPPAGAKTLDDVAGYAEDPEREVDVLTDYGYQWGWERFWGADDELASVFVDQFDNRDGAASYAADLARNDTDYYGGNPEQGPEGLPAGCRRLTVDEPDTETGLAGPAAFAWCAQGRFTVSVAAVGTSPEAALAELEDVVADQLGRLPEL